MLDITIHEKVRTLLKNKLEEMKSKNAYFSLRAFAKKLRIHPAGLSEIINGKRRMSGRLAARLAAGAGMSNGDLKKLFPDNILEKAFGTSDLSGDLAADLSAGNAGKGGPLSAGSYAASGVRNT